MMKLKTISTIIIALLFIACAKKTSSTDKSSMVKVAGAMKNVMWKGELGGIIQLDTINNREELYGLGPLAFLKGEILLLNGVTYVSKVDANGNPTVQLQETAKAPFFVYGNATEWTSQPIPNTVITLKALEDYISQVTDTREKPFIVKVEGTVNKATYHIQNLADNSIVTNPEEAHAGQRSFEIVDKEVILVGFYSKNHKGIFTHHDSNIHLHIITKDKTAMGHLDALNLNENARLYVSEVP